MSKDRAAQPIGTVTEETLDHIEQITGYRFKNQKRLDRALTHSSARNRTGRDYERLEFLGDRVLGLCVAELLFDRFESAKEGELSVRLNGLVNADTLAQVADEIGLHRFIRKGSDVVDIKGPRQKNIRADVVEALIASLYLEGGLDAARPFIDRYWAERASQAGAARRDAKTELQEWAHKMHQVTPTYTTVSRDGPDHEPIFKVIAHVADLPGCEATGASKRGAEQAAAALFLRREGVWLDEVDADE